VPKRKTHSGASKRIKVTGSGKLLHRRPSQNHFLQKKSSSRKRGYSLNHDVSSADMTKVKSQMGGL
jgi:large subunit ribosomal protein L35